MCYKTVLFRCVGDLICGFLNMCALHVGVQTTFYVVKQHCSKTQQAVKDS